MVAILWLLSLVPTLLAIAPVSATLNPGVDGGSLGEDHLARIAANRDLILSAPPPTPAPPLDTMATLASRQYNPRKRHPKRRLRGRALPSSEPVPNTIDVWGLDIYKFYEGSGFTESDDNPTTAGEPISQTTFPSTVTRGQAVQSCAEYSRDQSNFAFQLYFLGSQDIWVCRGYYDAGIASDSSYFNVANDDVLVAYGYQYSKKDA